MAPKQAIVRRLYRQLLMLYPRAFREQLGESMEQTFNDLYTARTQPSAHGRLGFVLGVFVETASGIVSEHVLLVREGVMTKRMLATHGLAAQIGPVLVLPFVTLEYVFQIRNNPRAMSLENLTSLAVLFGVLWLLPTVFLATLIPMVRTLRAGSTSRASPVFLVLRVVVLVLIAWVWGGLVVDQLPCFLGVPNCD